ncbi:hypothetical protein PR048_000283 [Dryococelus australis]|uniref:Uncharacterized protein n=1 Tax=Dryococelus australis TaxID=614101 RepID=A0ABQ9IE82_9NEOP|nr:hypothetical protein PR048_000283 [Dryococelus australis]
MPLCLSSCPQCKSGKVYEPADGRRSLILRLKTKLFRSHAGKRAQNDYYTIFSVLAGKLSDLKHCCMTEKAIPARITARLHSPMHTGSSAVCSLAIAPTPGSNGIRRVFPCKSDIGSEVFRAGLINCDPIAKFYYTSSSQGTKFLRAAPEPVLTSKLARFASIMEVAYFAAHQEWRDLGRLSYIEVLRADEVEAMRVRSGTGMRGRGGVVGEWISPRKYANQQHRPARSPSAKIREWPGRVDFELSLVRLRRYMISIQAVRKFNAQIAGETLMRNAGRPRSVRTIRLEEVIGQHISDMSSTRIASRSFGVQFTNNLYVMGRDREFRVQYEHDRHVRRSCNFSFCRPYARSIPYFSSFGDQGDTMAVLVTVGHNVPIEVKKGTSDSDFEGWPSRKSFRDKPLSLSHGWQGSSSADDRSKSCLVTRARPANARGKNVSLMEIRCRRGIVPQQTCSERRLLVLSAPLASGRFNDESLLPSFRTLPPPPPPPPHSQSSITPPRHVTLPRFLSERERGGGANVWGFTCSPPLGGRQGVRISPGHNEGQFLPNPVKQGEPVSIPGRATPGFPQVGIAPDDAAVLGGFFLGRSRFPPPLHSGAAPFRHHFTVVGSHVSLNSTSAFALYHCTCTLIRQRRNFIAVPLQYVHLFTDWMLEARGMRAFDWFSRSAEDYVLDEMIGADCEEIWAPALNIDVSRADEGEARKPVDRIRKSGAIPAGNRTRFAQEGGEQSNHHITAARNRLEISILASHQGDPGSIPGFSHVGIVPNDAVGRRVFSGIPVSPALTPNSLQSPSSALKTSILRAVQISSSLTHQLYDTCPKDSDFSVRGGYTTAFSHRSGINIGHSVQPRHQSHVNLHKERKIGGSKGGERLPPPPPPRAQRHPVLEKGNSRECPKSSVGTQAGSEPTAENVSALARETEDTETSI